MEELEIYFTLIEVFLGFNPILTLTLNFMVLFEKCRHVCLVAGTLACILIYAFLNTDKMGTGSYIEDIALH